MNNYTFLFTIIVLSSYLISNALAGNNYYVISIRRKKNDKEYDKATEEVKQAIDELVNDRMNDIYDIITDNKETYEIVEGEQDKKLDELEKASNLRKRHSGNPKFRFINKNRPERNKREFRKRANDPIEYIPFNSDLIKHISPVSNYYVIIAYLSDDLVEKVRKLPNVVSCTLKKRLEAYRSVYKREEEEPQKYYDKEAIKNETGWSKVEVQEQKHSTGLLHSNLSPLSQGIYKDNNSVYDNNYYYPESAGKGIDIYVVDDGWNALLNEETVADFDTYKGTKDERIVQCDAIYYEGEFHEPQNEKQCEVKKITDAYTHGIMVTMSAVGTVHGSAKKANLHMVTCELENYNILAALDYIYVNAKPHKTVVNLSLGCPEGVPDEECDDDDLQRKILEMVNKGIIIVVAAGNESSDRCSMNMFQGAEGVIAIGAIEDELIDYENPQKMYQPSSYTNYGECVVGFAPGTIRTPFINLENGDNGAPGTSFSSPLVAGVVATIMSENPNTEYTFETMKQKLIDLSIKDGLQNLDPNTPNRLINNGKKSIYKPPKCNDPSGKYHCGDQCCTKYGVCADFNIYEESPACLVENNQCISEFGRNCETRLCGKNNNNRHCIEGECCSATGHCVNVLRDREYKCFIENDCISEFGEKCLTKDISKLDEYKEEYQEVMLNHQCQIELVNVSQSCLFYEKLLSGEVNPKNQKVTCERFNNFDCDACLDNIMDFLPSCKRVGKNYGFKEETLEIMNLIKGTQKSYCAMKDSEHFCMTSNRLLYDDDYLTEEVDINEFCPYNGCKEPLILFIKGMNELYDSYNEYYIDSTDEEDLEFAEIIKQKSKKITEMAEVLKSDECKVKEIATSQENKEPTPTQTSEIGMQSSKDTKEKDKSSSDETTNSDKSSSDETTNSDKSSSDESKEKNESTPTTTKNNGVSKDNATESSDIKPTNDINKDEYSGAINVYPKFINCLIVISLIMFIF